MFALVLIPVGIEMAVRRRAPGFAARMDRPVRIGSAIFVAVQALDNVVVSVPAAVYSVVMFILAALWGMFISRRVDVSTEPVPA